MFTLLLCPPQQPHPLPLEMVAKLPYKLTIYVGFYMDVPCPLAPYQEGCISA